MPRRVPLIIDIEEITDSTHPVYLRDVNTYRAYVAEMKQRAADVMMYGRKEEKPSVPKWKVCDLNLNSWRENNMDGNSIYNILEKEKTILDDTKLPPKSRPPIPPDADLPPPPEDLEVQQERRYIWSTRKTATRPSADPVQLKRLLANAMQAYNKPVNSAIDYSYGFPRHSLDIQNLIPRKPKFETVTRIPAKVGNDSRRGNGKHVDPKTGQFCEILGPATCMKCIECVNRKMADTLQASSFPELSCSVTSLVGPKLARLLTKMDIQQSRRSRSSRRNRDLKSSTQANGRKPGILKFPTVTNFDAGRPHIVL